MAQWHPTSSTSTRAQALTQRAGVPNNTKRGCGGDPAHRRLEWQRELPFFRTTRRGEGLQSGAYGDRGQRGIRGGNACGTLPTVSLTAPANNATSWRRHRLRWRPPRPRRRPARRSPSRVLQRNDAAKHVCNVALHVCLENVAIGDYPLTAKAIDSKGTTATSTIATVHVKANVPPSVSMTAPANNSSYTAPAAINLAASATDTDGTIAKVEFYQGASRLATVTAAPYTYAWTNVAGGTYVLTAKATDDKGAVSTSAVVNVKVNKPPIISITAPANNAVIVLPATVTISATASDADGTVSKVDFYRDGILLGSDTTLPYSYAWANPAAGTYVLTAKATDNLGTVTTSAAVTITVKVNQPPAVSITSPVNGAQFRAVTPLTINAAATDSDGTISKVEFYGDGSLLGSDTTSPYSYAWTLPAAGTYVLTAKATDNKGAATTSAPVTVNVTLNQYPGSP